MNGRVYDAKLGRFLSADPFVQFPNYTQSFNRYSYVLNNPLSLTDPSGYLPDGGLLSVLGGPIGIIVSAYFAYDLYIKDDSSRPDFDVNQGAVGGAFSNSAGASLGYEGSGCIPGSNGCDSSAQVSPMEAIAAGTDTTRTGGKFANGGATIAMLHAQNLTDETEYRSIESRVDIAVRGDREAGLMACGLVDECTATAIGIRERILSKYKRRPQPKTVDHDEERLSGSGRLLLWLYKKANRLNAWITGAEYVLHDIPHAALTTDMGLYYMCRNRNTACYLPYGEGEIYPDGPEDLRQLELELRERLDVPASQEFVTDYP